MQCDVVVYSILRFPWCLFCAWFSGSPSLVYISDSVWSGLWLSSSPSLVYGLDCDWSLSLHLTHSSRHLWSRHSWMYTCIYTNTCVSLICSWRPLHCMTGTYLWTTHLHGIWGGHSSIHWSRSVHLAKIVQKAVSIHVWQLGIKGNQQLTKYKWGLQIIGKNTGLLKIVQWGLPMEKYMNWFWQ